MTDHRPPKTEINISTSTFVRAVITIIATILILAVLRITAHALLVIFIAFFLALALNAPVSFIARHMPGKIKGSRAWATSIAFLIVVLLLGGLIASFAPRLIQQTQNLVNAAPSLIEDARNQRGAVGDIIHKYNLENQVDKISGEVSGYLKNGTGKAFSTVQKIGASIFTMLTLLALTFMMLVEGPSRLEFFYELVPKKRKEMSLRMTRSMYKVVKGYVNGQVLLAAIAALCITPVLWGLGVRYPIGLMVVIFICGLIPMIGHTLGALIASAVALLTSLHVAIVVLLFYFLYQQAENYLIQPRIQANSTDMSPLLVFASVVIGVSFSGLLGGLLAIPIAGCIRIIVLEYLRSKKLIDSPVVEQTIQAATGSSK